MWYAKINLRRDNPSVFLGYVFVEKKNLKELKHLVKTWKWSKTTKNILCLNSRYDDLLNCMYFFITFLPICLWECFAFLIPPHLVCVPKLLQWNQSRPTFKLHIFPLWPGKKYPSTVLFSWYILYPNFWVEVQRSHKATRSY